jgi:NAD-dependent SIR2 family protein deacetylase
MSWFALVYIGSFATASCIRCGYKVAGLEIEEEVFAQKVPRCPHCIGHEDGIMKPDIVFFGENLPNEFHDKFRQDKDKVDLLIVMGSSLKVAPVANVKGMYH